MKKAIKFSFAALAAITLASCSGDDLLGNGSNTLKQNKKGLTVEVENMIDELTTRVAWTPNGNGVANYWQEGDAIWVMDNTLTMYDEYSWNQEEGAFVAKEGDDAVQNPQIALFQTNLKNFGWSYDTKGSEVTYEIPASWAWAEDKEVAGEGTVAYLSNLPLAGDMVKTTDGWGAGLRYLTGILRVALTNVPGNATTFKMEAYEDINGNNPAQITGTFKATLATKGVIDDEAVLVATVDDGETSRSLNTITVDLTEATFEESYLFIPLIVRDYGLWRFTITDKDEKVVWSKNVTERTVNRAGVTRLTVDEFKTAGEDIPAINRALEVQKEASEVTIETSKVTNVTAEENTIVIPAGMAAETITLDLAGLQGGTATNSKILSIVAEEGFDYEGELLVKLQDDATVGSITNVYVNLPKAKVSFAGKWLAGTTKIHLGGSGKSRSLIVKSLDIAKDAVVGNIYPNAACCDGNADEADIIVAEGASVVTLQLPDNTKIGAVTVNGTVSTLNAVVANDLNSETIVVDVTLGKTAKVTTLSTNQKKITVPTGATVSTLNSKNGAAITVQGTATYVNAYNGGTVSVSGTVTTLKADNESLSIPEDEREDTPQVTSLTVSGSGVITTANVRGANVTISRTANGDAIKTLLNMGENKKLTLSGGNIKKLAGATDLQFVNTEKAGVATAIGEVEDVTLAEKYVDYTSTWGEAAASSTYALTTHGTDKEIWTASQFAAYTGATAAKLVANINLNGKLFAPKANVTAAFDGNNKTISHVWIKKTAANKDLNVGLFKTVTANVSNLLIDDIAIQATTSGSYKPVVGTLAGEVSGTATITNVNVKSAQLTSDAHVVGGLFGNVASGTIEIIGTKSNEVFDANKFSTVNVKISGLNKLGGIIGQISNGGVTIKDYKAAATFTVTEEFDEAKRSNAKNYGTVAPYVGTATGGTLTVTENTNAKAVEFTYAERIKLGFKNNRVGDDDGNLYDFVGHTQIGYVSATSFALNTSISDVEKGYAKAKTELTNNANKNKLNVYLLESVYADQ